MAKFWLESSYGPTTESVLRRLDRMLGLGCTKGGEGGVKRLFGKNMCCKLLIFDTYILYIHTCILHYIAIESMKSNIIPCIIRKNILYMMHKNRYSATSTAQNLA